MVLLSEAASFCTGGDIVGHAAVASGLTVSDGWIESELAALLADASGVT